MQVDLHSGSNQSSDLGVNKWIGTPIYNNIDTIYQFSLSLLLFIAITVSIRIYNRMQLGEEDNALATISKWFFGLLLAFGLVTFLKNYVSSQNFGVYSPPTIY